MDSASLSNLRAIASEVAAASAKDDRVRAVLLTGSVARGDATVSSDVDLILVMADDTGDRAMRRALHAGVLIETVARSEDEWRERFHRPVPRWLYSFLEGNVLYDTGAGAQLVREAHEARSCYRTPAAVLEGLAAAFWHGQAKLDRALSSADKAVRGFQAGLAVDWIIDALFAVHNVPLPAASRRLDYLTRIAIDESMRADWHELLTGDVDERLAANARLQAELRARLPAPPLEAVM